MIEVHNITKSYGNKHSSFIALDNISCEIPTGASVAVVGKSGSGKSTLVHALSGLDRPESGEVRIDGHDILAMKQKEVDLFRAQSMGFVFQSFFVEESESCYDNVGVQLEIANVPASQHRLLIEKALDSVELLQKKNSPAGHLSGGQKQRLAIARAIVNRPKILFADEPTGNLDSATAEVVENLLFAFNRENQTTLIIVTHDPELANRCDMQIHITDGRVTSIQSSDAELQP